MADNPTRNIWELLGQVGKGNSTQSPGGTEKQPVIVDEAVKEEDVAAVRKGRGPKKKNGAATAGTIPVPTPPPRKRPGSARQKSGTMATTRCRAANRDVIKRGNKQDAVTVRGALALPSLDKLRNKLQITTKVSKQKSPVKKTSPVKLNTNAKMLSCPSLSTQNIFDRAKGFISSPCESGLGDIHVNARDSPSLGCIVPLDLSKASKALKVPTLFPKSDRAPPGDAPLDLSVRKRSQGEHEDVSPVKVMGVGKFDTGARLPENVSVVKPMMERTSIFPKPAHTNSDSLRRSPCAAINVPFTTGQWAPVAPLQMSDKGTPVVVTVRGKTVKVSPVRPQVKGKPVGEVQPSRVTRSCLNSDETWKPAPKDPTKSQESANVISDNGNISQTPRTAVCKPMSQGSNIFSQIQSSAPDLRCAFSAGSAFQPPQNSIPQTTCTSTGESHVASQYREKRMSTSTSHLNLQKQLPAHPHSNENTYTCEIIKTSVSQSDKSSTLNPVTNPEVLNVISECDNTEIHTEKFKPIRTSQVLNVPVYKPQGVRARQTRKGITAVQRKKTLRKPTDSASVSQSQATTTGNLSCNANGSGDTGDGEVGDPLEETDDTGCSRSSPDVITVNISEKSDVISVFITDKRLKESIINRSRSLRKASQRITDDSYQNTECDKPNMPKLINCQEGQTSGETLEQPVATLDVESGVRQDLVETKTRKASISASTVQGDSEVCHQGQDQDIDHDTSSQYCDTTQDKVHTFSDDSQEQSDTGPHSRQKPNNPGLNKDFDNNVLSDETPDKLDSPLLMTADESNSLVNDALLDTESQVVITSPCAESSTTSTGVKSDKRNRTRKSNRGPQHKATSQETRKCEGPVTDSAHEAIYTLSVAGRLVATAQSASSQEKTSPTPMLTGHTGDPETLRVVVDNKGRILSSPVEMGGNASSPVLGEGLISPPVGSTAVSHGSESKVPRVGVSPSGQRMMMRPKVGVSPSRDSSSHSIISQMEKIVKTKLDFDSPLEGESASPCIQIVVSTPQSDSDSDTDLAAGVSDRHPGGSGSSADEASAATQMLSGSNSGSDATHGPPTAQLESRCDSDSAKVTSLQLDSGSESEGDPGAKQLCISSDVSHRAPEVLHPNARTDLKTATSAHEDLTSSAIDDSQKCKPVDKSQKCKSDQKWKSTFATVEADSVKNISASQSVFDIVGMLPSREDAAPTGSVSTSCSQNDAAESLSDNLLSTPPPLTPAPQNKAMVSPTTAVDSLPLPPPLTPAPANKLEGQSLTPLQVPVNAKKPAVNFRSPPELALISPPVEQQSRLCPIPSPPMPKLSPKGIILPALSKNESTDLISKPSIPNETMNTLQNIPPGISRSESSDNLQILRSSSPVFTFSGSERKSRELRRKKVGTASPRTKLGRVITQCLNDHPSKKPSRTAKSNKLKISESSQIVRSEKAEASALDSGSIVHVVTDSDSDTKAELQSDSDTNARCGPKESVHISSDSADRSVSDIEAKEIFVIDSSDENTVLPDIPYMPDPTISSGNPEPLARKDRSPKATRGDKSPKRLKLPRPDKSPKSPKSPRRNSDNLYSIKYQNDSPLKATISKSLSATDACEDGLASLESVSRDHGISTAHSGARSKAKLTRTNSLVEKTPVKEVGTRFKRRLSTPAGFSGRVSSEGSPCNTPSSISAFVPTSYHDFSPISWTVGSGTPGKSWNKSPASDKDISQTRYYQTNILKQFLIGDDNTQDVNSEIDAGTPVCAAATPLKGDSGDTRNRSPSKARKSGSPSKQAQEAQSSPAKIRGASPGVAAVPNDDVAGKTVRKGTQIVPKDLHAYGSSEKESPKKASPKKPDWKSDLDEYKRKTRVPAKLIYIPKTLPKGYVKAARQLEVQRRKEEAIGKRTKLGKGAGKKSIPVIPGAESVPKLVVSEDNGPKKAGKCVPVKPQADFSIPAQMHCVRNKDPMKLKLCASPARTPESSPQAKVKSSPDQPLKLTFNLNPAPDSPTPENAATNQEQSKPLEQLKAESRTERDRSPIKLKLKLQRQRNRMKAFISKEKARRAKAFQKYTQRQDGNSTNTTYTGHFNQRKDVDLQTSCESAGRLPEITGGESQNLSTTTPFHIKVTSRRRRHKLTSTNVRKFPLKTNDATAASASASGSENPPTHGPPQAICEMPGKPGGGTRRSGSTEKRHTRMLEELRNTDGYIAEKRWKPSDNLFKDPSQLTREERALQRAIMQFTEMEMKSMKPGEKNDCPASPTKTGPMSSANQKAGQLKRRALQRSRGAKNTEAQKLGTTKQPKKGKREGKSVPDSETRQNADAVVDELPTIKPIKSNMAMRMYQRARKQNSMRRLYRTMEENMPPEEDPVRELLLADVGGSGDHMTPQVVYENAETGDVIERAEQISYFDTESVISDVTVTSSQDDIPPEVRRMNVRTAIGETVLHRLARLGYEEAAIWCAKTKYVDLNSRDNAGYTPLHEAAGNGHMNIARHLLEEGAAVNAGAHDGSRPLHDAIESDQLEMARLLLSCGADPRLNKYSGKAVLEMVQSQEMEEFLKGHLKDLQGHHLQTSEHSWKLMGSEVTDDDVLEEDESPEDCGFDVLGAAPEADNCCGDIEFFMSEEPLIPVYNLCINENLGCRNYALFSDVTSRSGFSRGELVQLCGPLCTNTITADFICKQLQGSILHTTEEITDLCSDLSEKPQEVVEMNDRLMALLNVSVMAVSTSDLEVYNKDIGEISKAEFDRIRHVRAYMEITGDKQHSCGLGHTKPASSDTTSDTALATTSVLESNESGDGIRNPREIARRKKKLELEMLTERLNSHLIQRKQEVDKFKDLVLSRKRELDAKQSEESELIGKMPHESSPEEVAENLCTKEASEQTDMRTDSLSNECGESQPGRTDVPSQIEEQVGSPILTSSGTTRTQDEGTDFRSEGCCSRITEKSGAPSETIVLDTESETEYNMELSVPLIQEQCDKDNECDIGAENNTNSNTNTEYRQHSVHRSNSNNSCAVNTFQNGSIEGVEGCQYSVESDSAIPRKHISDNNNSSKHSNNVSEHVLQGKDTGMISRISKYLDAKMSTNEGSTGTQNSSQLDDLSDLNNRPCGQLDDLSDINNRSSGAMNETLRDRLSDISHTESTETILPQGSGQPRSDGGFPTRNAVGPHIKQMDIEHSSAALPEVNSELSRQSTPRIESSLIPPENLDTSKPLDLRQSSTAEIMRAFEESYMKPLNSSDIPLDDLDPNSPIRWRVSSNTCVNETPKRKDLSVDDMDNVIVIVPRDTASDPDEVETLPYSGDEDGRSVGSIEDLQRQLDDNDNDRPWMDQDNDHERAWDVPDYREYVDDDMSTLSAASPLNMRMTQLNSDPQLASPKLLRDQVHMRSLLEQKSGLDLRTQYNPNTNYHSIQSLLNSPPKSSVLPVDLKIMEKVGEATNTSKSKTKSKTQYRSQEEQKSAKSDNISRVVERISKYKSNSVANKKNVVDQLKEFSKKGVSSVLQSDVAKTLQDLREGGDSCCNKESAKHPRTNDGKSAEKTTSATCAKPGSVHKPKRDGDDGPRSVIRHTAVAAAEGGPGNTTQNASREERITASIAAAQSMANERLLGQTGRDLLVLSSPQQELPGADLATRIPVPYGFPPLAMSPYATHVSPLHLLPYASPPAHIYPYAYSAGVPPALAISSPVARTIPSPVALSSPVARVLSSPVTASLSSPLLGQSSPCPLKISDVHSLTSPTARTHIDPSMFASPPRPQRSPYPHIASRLPESDAYYYGQN